MLSDVSHNIFTSTRGRYQYSVGSTCTSTCTYTCSVPSVFKFAADDAPRRGFPASAACRQPGRSRLTATVRIRSVAVLLGDGSGFIRCFATTLFPLPESNMHRADAARVRHEVLRQYCHASDIGRDDECWRARPIRCSEGAPLYLLSRLPPTLAQRTHPPTCSVPLQRDSLLSPLSPSTPLVIRMACIAAASTVNAARPSTLSRGARAQVRLVAPRAAR